MKIALICDSLLLDRSLEMYLKEYLTSYKLCDFVVTTQPMESQKPVFLIGDFEDANLKIPFTREILLQELEDFDREIKSKAIQESKDDDFQDCFNPQEEDSSTTANLSNVGFEIPDTIESPTKTSNQLTFTDSALNTKIEEILRRYAKEIEEIVLKHYEDKK